MLRLKGTWLSCAFFLLFSLDRTTAAFIPVTRPTASRAPSLIRMSSDDNDDNKVEDRKSSSPLDFIMNPYESKIPKELEAQIYAAQDATPAAKDRKKRVGLYALAAFILILGAFFNVFLSELRGGPGLEEGVKYTLADAGFGWAEESNFLVRFLFLNKIGGGFMLLSGAGAGLLAEAEFDTRRINSEKIFEEMKRRREDKETKGVPKKGKGKKKRQSGKESKRLRALAEIIDTEPVTSSEIVQPVEEKQEETSEKEQTVKKEKEKDGGIVGAFKGFYEKADNMAASQALLLNQKLEEQGLIEKITDESGLKVIGKEAASKLRQEQDNKASKESRD
jgi:hypothetical protein